MRDYGKLGGWSTMESRTKCGDYLQTMRVEWAEINQSLYYGSGSRNRKKKNVTVTGEDTTSTMGPQNEHSIQHGSAMSSTFLCCMSPLTSPLYQLLPKRETSIHLRR